MPKATSGVSVSLRSITHQYSDSGLILDQLSLDIRPGEFVSFLGPSGCGKSTLLRLLGTLDRPATGSIQFGAQRMAPVRGFVFQEPRLLPWRSVLENVKLPLELKGDTQETSRQKAIRALKRVGLEDALDRYPAQLSGGMKMRVSVARALVFQPSLLLLDEPFSALDEPTRHSLQEDLRNLWESFGMTVIFVTHSISEAVFLSDRTIVLSKRPARIISDRTLDLPSQRKAELRLDRRFNLEVKKISEFLSLKEDS